MIFKLYLCEFFYLNCAKIFQFLHFWLIKVHDCLAKWRNLSNMDVQDRTFADQRRTVVCGSGKNASPTITLLFYDTQLCHAW